MNYVAIVNGEEREVEVNEVASGVFDLTMKGKKIRVDSSQISDTTQSIICGIDAFNIESEKNANGGENLLVRGHIVGVDVVDLRTLKLRHAQQALSGPEGPATISAPMPGKVVAVLVEEGQQVTQGQGLVVVEAMKMENELRAPRAGKVTKLRAVSGAVIEGGFHLCTVE